MWPIKSLKNIGTQPKEAFILLPLMVYWFLQILMWPVCVCVSRQNMESSPISHKTHPVHYVDFHL